MYTFVHTLLLTLAHPPQRNLSTWCIYVCMWTSDPREHLNVFCIILCCSFTRYFLGPWGQHLYLFLFTVACYVFPLPPPPMLYLCLFFLSVLDACFYPLQQYSGVAVAKRLSECCVCSIFFLHNCHLSIIRLGLWVWCLDIHPLNLHLCHLAMFEKKTHCCCSSTPSHA